MKIRIDVPVYNRKKITELCLHQLNVTKNEEDEIFIYNDNSSEYDNQWLSKYGTVVNVEMPLQDRWRNIHKIRSFAYRSFLNSGFDVLYMTDNDAFHDKDWRSNLMNASLNTNMPVTGYISNFMYLNYKHYYDRLNEIFSCLKDYDLINSTGGGISIFLKRSMVQTIVSRMGYSDIEDMWDCMSWGYLNNSYIITSSSYLEHYGKGGLHHDSWDLEKAVKPTRYLQQTRHDILNYLNDLITRDEIFQKI